MNRYIGPFPLRVFVSALSLRVHPSPRTSGSLLETTVEAFGKHVVRYDGTPVITDDFVSDAQTQGAVTTCSSSSAVRFGMEGVMGLQNGECAADFETKDNGH